MAFAQASSDKVLASAVDVASLAPKALRQVCTLVSACCVGRKADTIISDLENWWHELGQDILFRSDPFADCEPEDLEEEAGDFEQGNGQVTPEKQEEVDLLQSLEMTGNLVATEKELLKYQTGDDQDLPQEFIPEPILEDADSSEDEVAEDGIPFKLDAENVFTLEHVLDGAGLANFKPKKEDSESKKLQRVRILSRQMQHFCAFVRVSERILSRAKVMGMRRPQNQNNLLQHMLAEARQTYQCSALRQSRQALWKDFSSRVVADVEADLDKENGAIRVPQHLGTMAVSKEERKFQLLVVRPCSSSTAFGGLRLGLVVAAWRGGKSKNNEQAQKLRPSGSLPAHYVTTVHVMLLMPYQSGVDAKSYFQTSFIGSFPVGCFQHLFYFIFFICIQYFSNSSQFHLRYFKNFVWGHVRRWPPWIPKMVPFCVRFPVEISRRPAPTTMSRSSWMRKQWEHCMQPHRPRQTSRCRVPIRRRMWCSSRKEIWSLPQRMARQAFKDLFGAWSMTLSMSSTKRSPQTAKSPSPCRTMPRKRWFWMICLPGRLHTSCRSLTGRTSPLRTRTLRVRAQFNPVYPVQSSSSCFWSALFNFIQFSSIFCYFYWVLLSWPLIEDWPSCAGRASEQCTKAWGNTSFFPALAWTNSLPSPRFSQNEGRGHRCIGVDLEKITAESGLPGARWR